MSLPYPTPTQGEQTDAQGARAQDAEAAKLPGSHLIHRAPSPHSCYSPSPAPPGPAAPAP